jgi:hypothetical protein
MFERSQLWLCPMLLLAPASVVVAQTDQSQTLLDQAAASLDALSKDAADTSALFGIPTGEQAKRVGEQAKSALKNLDQAEALIRAQLDRARVSPPQGAERERIRRLREVEMGVRVPILRGRAAALIGMVDTDPDQRSIHLTMASSALNNVSGLPVAAEGIRRVTLAAAIVGRNTGGRGGDAARKAAEVLRGVLELPVGTDPQTTVAKLTRFEATIALAQCVDSPAELRRLSERAANEAVEPLLRVVSVEALARGMKRLGGGTLDPKITGIDNPADVLASLMSRKDLGLTGEQAELLYYEKLAGAYRDDPRNSTDQVMLARGIVLARSEESRGGGLALLDRVAIGTGPVEVRASAAWYAAAFRAQSEKPGDKLRGVGSLITLARRTPTSKRADVAVRAGIARARELVAHKSNDPNEDGPTVLGDALAAGIERFGIGEEADQYRCELAQMIPINEAADLSKVLERVAAIGPSSKHATWASTLVRKRVNDHLEAVRATLKPKDEKGNEKPLNKLAAERLAQSYNVALVVLRSCVLTNSDRATIEELTTELAETRVLAGLPDGDELFKELIAAGAGERVRGGKARLSLGLARAQRQIGKEQAAFNTLRDFTAPMDAPDSTAARPPEYWLAWAEMLEILQKQNARGELTQDIRLKVRQLQALDPSLGQPEAARRITAVEQTLR